jgi:hypothetical protein
MNYIYLGDKNDDKHNILLTVRVFKICLALHFVNHDDLMLSLNFVNL